MCRKHPKKKRPRCWRTKAANLFSNSCVVKGRTMKNIHRGKEPGNLYVAEEYDRHDINRPMVSLSVPWHPATALHDIALAMGVTKLHPAMVIACDSIEAHYNELSLETIRHILDEAGVTAALADIEGGTALIENACAAFREGRCC